ncbi:MAG: alpha/beta fold hydrolase [Jatrophihabitans sp.]
MASIVLVGGSCLGAWAWERVTPTLASAGHDVHPLTLTGFGDRAHLLTAQTDLTMHATDIVAAIEMADLHDVVLVAHSYAGAPATVAASFIPERIKRIVYVAALLPEGGKTLFEVSPEGFEEIISGYLLEDGLRIAVINDYILDNFYGQHGLDDAGRAWLRARSFGQPIATYRDRAPDDLSAVEALPRTYLKCSGDPGDPTLPVGIERIELDSGHWPMITAPDALAAMVGFQADR